MEKNGFSLTCVLLDETSLVFKTRLVFDTQIDEKLETLTIWQTNV